MPIEHPGCGAAPGLIRVNPCDPWLKELDRRAVIERVNTVSGFDTTPGAGHTDAMTDDDYELTNRIEAGGAAVMMQTSLLHQEFGRANSEWKPDGTRVTAADLAISKAIFHELAAQFPDDQLFSEEQAASGQDVTATWCWVLDPIDGTNNFALGIPHCAIGLALLRDGQPVYGFVYDFARRILMHGGPSRGVWDGERSAGIKNLPLTSQSIVGFHTPYDPAFAPHAGLLAERFKLRALGSSTIHLAYVAAGLFDAVVDHNVKVWDIAAAVPLVLASGGTFHFVSPSPFPLRRFDLGMARIVYMAGNATAVDELRALLKV